MTWFLIHCKARKEKLVCHQLTLHGYETYYPFIHTQKQNKICFKEEAFFPGYVFIHAASSSIDKSSIQWIPGVIRFVSFGNELAFITDQIKHWIEVKVIEINSSNHQALPTWTYGDHVVINDGLFKGFTGIVEGPLNGNERVRILLKYLEQKSMVVDLDTKEITVTPKLCNHLFQRPLH
jgi:transcription antitermination factor NusG